MVRRTASACLIVAAVLLVGGAAAGQAFGQAAVAPQVAPGQPPAPRQPPALSPQEQAVLEGQAPWGRGAGSWDWERVLEEHPGVDEQVVQTLALVHVLLEAAFAPEGPCGT